MPINRVILPGETYFDEAMHRRLVVECNDEEFRWVYIADRPLDADYEGFKYLGHEVWVDVCNSHWTCYEDAAIIEAGEPVPVELAAEIRRYIWKDEE